MSSRQALVPNIQPCMGKRSQRHNRRSHHLKRIHCNSRHHHSSKLRHSYYRVQKSRVHLVLIHKLRQNYGRQQQTMCPSYMNYQLGNSRGPLYCKLQALLLQIRSHLNHRHMEKVSVRVRLCYLVMHDLNIHPLLILLEELRLSFLVLTRCRVRYYFCLHLTKLTYQLNRQPLRKLCCYACLLSQFFKCHTKHYQYQNHSQNQKLNNSLHSSCQHSMSL